MVQEPYAFICIDINLIVAHVISKQVINSYKIVRVLERAINSRFKTPGIKKLIIHTDRGRQFLSKTYKNFADNYSKFFISSMSQWLKDL